MSRERAHSAPVRPVEPLEAPIEPQGPGETTGASEGLTVVSQGDEVGEPSVGRSKGPGHGGPAKGPGWPPFEQGNVVRMKGGARSPRVYQPVAKALVAGLLEDRPDLAAFPEAVAAWGEAEAQALVMRRHLAEEGVFVEGTSRPRAGTLTWWNTFERRAAQARAVLGLDPMSEAKLQRDRAAAAAMTSVDLGELAARGQAALEARGEPDEADIVGETLAAVIEAAPVHRPRDESDDEP